MATLPTMRGITTFAIVSAVLLAGCSSSTDTDTNASSLGVQKTSISPSVQTTSKTPEVNKYKQTWTIPYDQTTCTQFQNDMTRQQAWAMSADMLTGARNAQKKTGLPSDELVEEFLAGLINVCVGDKLNLNMADVGTGLYLTEPRFHP